MKWLSWQNEPVNIKPIWLGNIRNCIHLDIIIIAPLIILNVIEHFISLVLLKNLHPNKAQGPDCFHPKLLKELSKEIVSVLPKMFQLSLNSGEVPLIWRKRSIVPIYKTAAEHKPSN